MDDEARVRHILDVNEHMVLSTANDEGDPWVTPLSYVFDDKGCLYWVSSKESRHSLNIRARERVAIVIYMTEPASDAIYIDAVAKELDADEEIVDVIRLRNSRPQLEKFKVKTVADVTGASAWRIYKAIPTELYFRGQTHVDGRLVTVRRRLA